MLMKTDAVSDFYPPKLGRDFRREPIIEAKKTQCGRHPGMLEQDAVKCASKFLTSRFDIRRFFL